MWRAGTRLHDTWKRNEVGRFLHLIKSYSLQRTINYFRQRMKMANGLPGLANND